MINFNYQDKILVKDNYISLNTDTKNLIDIFPKFLEKIKKAHLGKEIYYQGDNPYINSSYYKEQDKVIIFLRLYNFHILSEYIQEKFYKKLFKDRGNWKNYHPGQPLDLLVVEGDKYNKDKSLYGLESLIKNQINLDSLVIAKKNSLHKAINPSLHESFLPEQMRFTLTPSFKVTDEFKDFIDKHRAVILKPVDGHGGKEITIIDNFRDFKKKIAQEMNLKIKDRWSTRKTKANQYITKFNWVLEEYIIDPHLYQGRKYHIRPYFIYHQNQFHKQAFLFSKIRLAIANQAYRPEDFDNKDIHDTHYTVKENIELVYLEEALGEKYQDVIDQLVILFRDIANKMNTTCYPESKLCYQVFAPDVMITSDHQVKLLEINTQPGFNLELNTSGEIFENIMYHIVDKILPPKNEIKNPGMFITLLNEKMKDYSPRGLAEPQVDFIKAVADTWHKEGYGPAAKKDKTGGYYLTCKKGDINENDFHIHVVGPKGRVHINSWSRKGPKKRIWEALDFRLTPKEQTYYIYNKSGYRKHKNCLDYYAKNHK